MRRRRRARPPPYSNLRWMVWISSTTWRESFLSCRKKPVRVEDQSRETWNPPAPAGGGMRRNSREVALSSASRDNSTCKFRCTLFLKLGSYYYRVSPAPAGGGSPVEGTLNVLEAAQHAGIRRFVYTSSIHAIKRIGGQYLIDIQDHPSYTFNCVAERFGEYWE